MGMKQDSELKQQLKPSYLEWLVLTRGIKEGRNLFQDSSFQHPPDLQLIRKMITLELVQSSVDVGVVSKCYELIVTLFGKVNNGRLKYPSIIFIYLTIK